MATLVFSTVGTALGGPVGGAIGALIGQSIDQQILAPARRGPRLGDLKIQSSAYGTQIPRIYGTMRVAGSVIWATDLVESTQGSGGAKGQPSTSYSYSVSMAVALSSRPATAIKRIWADGKLLRGSDGDFKVSTDFRFTDGSEDQAIDPLIGSTEGIDKTPAYRGLALAVFENLQLAEYGNRIPFLTFEVEGNDGEPTIAAVLSDASRGLIECDAHDVLPGFAAYGASIRAAIEPLTTTFAVQLFDDGLGLRSTGSLPLPIGADELGNSADASVEPRIRREQDAARSLPTTVLLSYYDPKLDYQSGQSRALASERTGSEERIDLAAMLDTETAKGLAQAIVARRWASRDRLSLRLPPRHLAVEPGTVLSLLDLRPALWTVQQCTVDGFVVAVMLRPALAPVNPIQADPGRVADNPDVIAGETAIALFDLPAPGLPVSVPTLLLGASRDSAGWSSSTVELLAGGTQTAIRTAARKTVLGAAAGVLPTGQPWLIDAAASVDIDLIDPNQWLVSCDDDALVGGFNLAALGQEMIQFGNAVSLGGGRFRLSRLLRGRGGTEWATGNHAAGERFALIETAAMQQVALPLSTIGSTVHATPLGISGEPGEPVSIVASGEALRPPSSIDLKVAIAEDGAVQASWTRRSRQGFAWIDGIDAPMGEARERYLVTVGGVAGSVEFQTDAPSIALAGSDLGAAGLGAGTITIRQIGDWGLSHPAQAAITIA